MHLGTIAALSRYPVKGMLGEQLNSSVVTGAGLAGDRAYALVDSEGKIGTPKLPRKWVGLLQSRSRYLAEPDTNYQPPAQITLPDGERIMSDDSEVNLRLSRMVGRDVTLISEKPAGLILESPPLGQVPDDDEGPLLQLPVPNGFFDLGSLHLLTTATLAALTEASPGTRFEPRRFRPNIIVETPEGRRRLPRERLGRRQDPRHRRRRAHPRDHAHHSLRRYHMAAGRPPPRARRSQDRRPAQQRQRRRLRYGRPGRLYPPR